MFYLMEQLARERQHTMLIRAEADRLAHRLGQERRAQRRAAWLEAAAARATARARALAASVAGMGIPAQGRSG